MTLSRDRRNISAPYGLEKVSDATIRSSLDRLGSVGLPVYISELDVNIADDDVQLERYKSLFPILWQNSAVKGVTLWGYKQNHIWKSHAYLLRSDGSERPALAWLKEYWGHWSDGRFARHFCSRLTDETPIPPFSPSRFITSRFG
ncbi:MAG: endo-1,4-beta-xylanase [Chthoniobacterales bacterium]